MLDGFPDNVEWSDPRYRDRHVVESVLAKELGDDLACIVVSDDGCLHVYVTSRGARHRALDLLRHSSRAQVDVKEVDPRFRATTLRVIRDAVLAARPGDAVNSTAIAIESPLGSEACPRVEITIPLAGDATAQTEAWAAAMQEAWGADRVVVRRRTLKFH